MPKSTKDVLKWMNENGNRAEAYENDVMNKVAKKYNISTDELDEIIIKVMFR